MLAVIAKLNVAEGKEADFEKHMLGLAEQVRDQWNTRGNCMLVGGATYPDELRQIRALVGDMTLLVPGIGAQGGDIEKTVRAGLNTGDKGMIIKTPAI